MPKVELALASAPELDLLEEQIRLEVEVAVRLVAEAAARGGMTCALMADGFRFTALQADVPPREIVIATRADHGG